MRTQRKRTEKRHILRSLFKLLTPTGQKFVKRYIFSPMLAVMFGLGSASVWGLGVTNTADLATFNPSYESEVFTPGTVIANKDCVVNLNTIIGNNTVFQSKKDGTFTFTEGVEISSSRTAPFVFDFNAKFSGNGSLTVNNAKRITIQKNFDIQEMKEFEFTAETSILDGGEIITSKTSSAIISNTFNSNGTEWNGNVTITSGNGDYIGTDDEFNSTLTIENGAKALLEKGTAGTSVNKLTVQGSDNGFYSYASISGDGTEITELIVTDDAKAVLAYAADAKTINVNSSGHVQLGDLNDDGTFIKESGASAGTINVSDPGSEVNMYGSTADSLIVDNATGNVNNDSTVGSMTVQNAGTGTLDKSEVTNKLIVQNANSSATLTDSKAGNMEVTDGAKATLEKNSEVTNKLTVKDANSSAKLTDSKAGNMDVTDGAKADLYDESKVLETINVSGTGEGDTIENPLRSTVTLNSGSSAKDMNVLDGAEAKLNNGNVTNKLTVQNANSSATLTDSKAGNMEVTDSAEATLNNSEVTGTLNVTKGETGGATADLYAGSKVLETINVSGEGSSATLTDSKAGNMEVTDSAEATLNNSEVTNDMTVTGEGSEATLKGNSTERSTVGGNLYVKEKGKATLNNSTVGTEGVEYTGTLEVTGGAEAKLENSRVEGKLFVRDGEYERDADGNIVFDENGIAKLIGSKVTMATDSSASSLDVTDFGDAELDNASIDGKISISRNASVTLKNGSTAKSAVITDISSIVLTGEKTNIEDIKVSGYDIERGLYSGAILKEGASAGNLTLNSGTIGLLNNGNITGTLAVNGANSMAQLWDGSSAGYIKVTNGAYARLDNSTNNASGKYTHAGTITVSGSNKNVGPSQVDLLNGSTADSLTIENGAKAYLENSCVSTEDDKGVIYVLGVDENLQYSSVTLSGSHSDIINASGHRIYEYKDENNNTQTAALRAEINLYDSTSHIITLGNKNDNGTWDLGFGSIQNGSYVNNLTVQGSDNGFYSIASISGEGTKITTELRVTDGAYAVLKNNAYAETINVNSLGYVQLGRLNDDDTVIEGSGASAGWIKVGGHKFDYNVNGEITGGKVSVAEINGSNVTKLTIGTQNDGDKTWNLANGYIKNSTIGSLIVQGSDNGFYSYASISGEGTEITKCLKVTDGAYAVLADAAYAENILASGVTADADPSEVDIINAKAGSLRIENGAFGYLVTGNVTGRITVDGANSMAVLWDGSSAGSIEVTKGAYARLDNSKSNASGKYTHAGTITVSGENSQVDLLNDSFADSLKVSNYAHGYLVHATIKNSITVDSGAQVDWYAENSKLGTKEDNGSVVIGENAVLATQAEIISTADIELNAGTLYITDNRYEGDKTTDSSGNNGTADDDRHENVGTVDPEYNESDSSGNNTADNTTDSSENGPTVALGNNTTGDSGTPDSSENNELESSENNAYDGQYDRPTVGYRETTQEKFKDPTNDKGTVDKGRYEIAGTVDSEGMVTLLHYDNIKSFIENAKPQYNEKGEKISEHDHILTGSLSGDGTLRVQFDSETTGALILQGDASKFQGTADVYRGALVVDGTTVGKENTGTVNVYRDARDGSDWYRGGTLAFTSSNGTAPAIHTGTIDFTCRVTDENGEEINPSTGSLLYFDTQNVRFDTQNVGFDTKNVGTLATIDANTIKLDYDPDLDGKILDGDKNGNESMENTQIWYDGAYNLAGKDLKIELGKETQFENASGSMSDENVEGFFSTQLIKAERDNNNNNNVINLNVQTFTEYAADKDWGGTFNNSAENAEKLINELLDTGGEYYKLADAIYNENNEEKVKQTISNLGHNNGLVNILGVGNNLGMVGSSFFGGGLSSMGGVTQRGQEEQAENPVSADPLPTKEEDPNKWTAWASYSHSSINASSYQDGGTIDGYDVRRTGILTGLRKTLSDTFSMGVLFAYSAPELNQSGTFNSYEWKQEKDGKTFTSQVLKNSYHSNIEMDDFQFALHFEKMLGRNWQLSAFLGGGAQTLEWNRKMWVDKLYEFTGDTTGNTLTATIYLIKNLQLSKNFSLMPTVGLDSEHSWLWGFREEGTGIKDLGMNLTNILATDQSYRRMTYSRQTFRIGTTATLTSPSNIYGFSGRIFYGRQISDKESATLEYTNKFLDDSYFSVDGHKMGRDSWNLGFGGYMYLNTAKTLTIKADYNTIMYRNSSTQNVTAGLQWRF